MDSEMVRRCGQERPSTPILEASTAANRNEDTGGGDPGGDGSHPAAGIPDAGPAWRHTADPLADLDPESAQIFALLRFAKSEGLFAHRQHGDPDDIVQHTLDPIVAAIDEARRAGLVWISPAAARVGFRHGYTRHVLWKDLSLARRLEREARDAAVPGDRRAR